MKTRSLVLGILAIGVVLSMLWWPLLPESAILATSPARTAPAVLAEREATRQMEAGSDAARTERSIIGDTLKNLASESDPQRAEDLIQALLAAVAPADLLQALAETNDQSNPWNPTLRLRLLRHWAQTDPVAAAAALSQTRLDSSTRTAALDGLAVEWTAQNLPAALDWVRQLSNPHERQEALLTIAYEAARTSPPDALAIASELTDAPVRVALISYAAAQWATRTPAAAAAWAEQLPNPNLREQTLAAVASAWADRDPVAAGTLAVTSLPPGRIQDDSVINIVQRWKQQQPSDAARWVENFPTGELRNAAAAMLGGVVKNADAN